MSFKSFSAAQATPSNDKPKDKTTAAAAVDAPVAKAGSKPDKAAPAQK